MRWGDTTSLKVFTACLESIFRKLIRKSKVMMIDGEYLSHLRFANDIVLNAKSTEYMKSMIVELNKESMKVG